MLQVFQNSGSDIFSRGDSWVLMFFAVALANRFIYFVLGWSANVIIQVSASRRSCLSFFSCFMVSSNHTP
jgi:hypothetical protein